MITEEEKNELFKTLVEETKLLSPESAFLLCNCLKRPRMPRFDYYKLFYTLIYVYGVKKESLRDILSHILAPAELLDKPNRSARQNRKLFEMFSTLGLSNKEISAILGVAQNTVSRWNAADGKSLIEAAMAEESKPAQTKLEPGAQIARKNFRKNFYKIMKNAAKAAKKELTPKALEAYLATQSLQNIIRANSAKEINDLERRNLKELLNYSRRALVDFIKRYEELKKIDK